MRSAQVCPDKHLQSQSPLFLPHTSYLPTYLLTSTPAHPSPLSTPRKTASSNTHYTLHTTHIHTHIQTYIHTYREHTYIHTYIRTYIHTHTYTRTHAPTHPHSYSSPSLPPSLPPSSTSFLLFFQIGDYHHPSSFIRPRASRRRRRPKNQEPSPYVA